jgi:nucleoside-diphosphate-sugar epimerase
MKVLVTGGTGTVGRAAVERLVRHGHQVRVIGRRRGIAIEGAEYRACDITDFACLRDQMKGMEGVVHLAAIIHPSLAPGQEIFRVNCAGTFNVYRAAADHGINRLVCASSINALGYNFGIKNFPLLYFPMDEEHPTCTTDPYSFSKQIMEETAAYFWRREGVSSVCLRLPAVYEIVAGQRGVLLEFVSRSQRAYAELMALPEEQQRTRARQVIDEFERLRTERAWEEPREGFGINIPHAPLMFGRSNFWTSIDARDSAQAIEKGLLADYQGSLPLFINDSHNFSGIETETLVRLCYPEVKARKRPLEGTEALVSIDKARALLGFEPEYSVRDWHKHGEGDL